MFSLPGQFFFLFGLRDNGDLDFTPEADAIWANFQNDNRARIDLADVLREDVICRLSSAPMKRAPMQTLAVAIIFSSIPLGFGKEP